MPPLDLAVMMRPEIRISCDFRTDEQRRRHRIELPREGIAIAEMREGGY